MNLEKMIFDLNSNGTSNEHICKTILHIEFSHTRIRAWDLFILLPNAMFIIFLAMRLGRARLKLRATSSPVFLAFYIIVSAGAIAGTLRGIISIALSVAGGPAPPTVDKLLWVTVRALLLATEISVLIFGLACGHLESGSSTRHVLITTTLVSIAFASGQGALELTTSETLYGHGGALFCLISSLVLAVLYLGAILLPLTPLRHRIPLPTKRAFYVYCTVLCVLHATQAIGATLMWSTITEGLCLVDFTAAFYFTLLPPIVYRAFLSDLLGATQPPILFSYKAQVDDAVDDDAVSLPHQQSLSSLKTDSDYVYQPADITHFGPLYTASLQSPDSIGGYSVASTETR